MLDPLQLLDLRVLLLFFDFVLIHFHDFVLEVDQCFGPKIIPMNEALQVNITILLVFIANGSFFVLELLDHRLECIFLIDVISDVIADHVHLVNLTDYSRVFRNHVE